MRANEFTLPYWIAESINKDGITFAFHLRTPKAGCGCESHPTYNALDVREHSTLFRDRHENWIKRLLNFRTLF
jgi:hypothetical protein